MIVIIRGVVHSRLFPDIFPKQFFPDLMLPNRWSIETLKNLFFSKCTANVSNHETVLYNADKGELWNFSFSDYMPWLRALVVALKKKLQTFYNFPDLVSNFQTFSMPGKLLCKFQDFFKNSRLCMSPVITIILGRRISTETNLCCFVSASRLYLTSLTSDFSTSKAPSRSLTLSWTKKVK